MRISEESIQAVYHIAHLDNVRGILRDGVWSHNKAQRRQPPPTTVYDEHVMFRRAKKMVGDKPLLDFANFYFQPYNPILFRFRREKKDVVILRFRRDIMNIPGAYISVGNAATAAAEFYPATEEGERELLKHCQELNYPYSLTKEVGSIKMSELLVPDCVPSSFIDFIFTPEDEITEAVKQMTNQIPVEFDMEFFLVD